MMSVSTIIKNTILVVLIILIGHFMIQNILVDKKPLFSHQNTPVKQVSDNTKKYQSSPIDVNAEVDGKHAEAKVNLPVVCTERPVGLPSSQTVSAVNGGLDKAKQELLKFVDDEDDNMETFFTQQTPTLKMEAIPSDNCKLKTQDSMLPLTTTCDPLVSDLKQPSKVMTNSSVAYDKKGLMILKEYENESTMNGGSLYGGLSAFDTFNDNFQPLSL
jgi:hypothetical protein